MRALSTPCKATDMLHKLNSPINANSSTLDPQGLAFDRSS
jgi:hypothetical protein